MGRSTCYVELLALAELLVSLPIIHLNGNLGHDAQLRYTVTGTPVLNFNVACSGYVGSGERRREHVDYP